MLVARIFCEGRNITVEPLPPDGIVGFPFDVTALFAKLRYLVETAAPNPYERLLSLRSDYWSFQALDAAEARGALGGRHRS